MSKPVPWTAQVEAREYSPGRYGIWHLAEHRWLKNSEIYPSTWPKRREAQRKNQNSHAVLGRLPFMTSGIITARQLARKHNSYLYHRTKDKPDEL